MKKIVIPEKDYDIISKQIEWDKMKIIRWEHDFIKKIYIIDYEEINEK